MDEKSVTVLGINGHIGHAAAEAFVKAGWKVKGFGRSNKQPLEGVSFVEGDAGSVDEMRRAIGESAVVVNALNLPYDQWDKGRLEAQNERVIEAASAPGRTLMFPGNIYIYAASDRVLAPETQPRPEVPRGAIRVRVEDALKRAATRGDLQVVILRSADFYGPGTKGDYYDLGIMREVEKGKVAMLAAPHLKHAWAYLPDLGAAFAKVAAKRDELAAFECFHFAGHFERNSAHLAAIQKAAPRSLKAVSFPWGILKVIGLFSGVTRGVVQMRYLWENPMELVDPRLDDILGPDFGTPFEEAVAATVKPFFAK